jgi:uncharacterized membrane protein YgdD (TMEM256/DUF423 family)
MNWMMLGSIFGFFGVALGAFGAHGLQDKLDAHSLEIFHTGAQYQMYHALALLGVGIWGQNHPQEAMLPGWAFTIGIMIFSGSLYALSTTGIRILGAITPIGGLAFLIGWLSLGWAAYKA